MKRKKSESRMDETLSLDVLKCFVCMDLVLEPTKTPCHCRTFSCAGCLAEWIKHAQAECLVCHQRFSARRLATDEGVKAYIVNRYPREYALRQAGESSTLFDQVGMGIAVAAVAIMPPNLMLSEPRLFALVNI